MVSREDIPRAKATGTFSIRKSMKVPMGISWLLLPGPCFLLFLGRFYRLFYTEDHAYDSRVGIGRHTHATLIFVAGRVWRYVSWQSSIP